MNNKFSKILRIQEWWSFILPPILLFYYLGLFNQKIPESSILPLYTAIILFSVCTAITGYFINDLYDIKADAIAGKYNFVSTQSKVFRYLFLPFIITILIIINYSIIHLVPSLLHIIVTILIAFNLFLFFIYSVPFIHLKYNPYAAIILDAMYSGPLFYVIAYLLSTMGYVTNHSYLAIIFLWGILKGIRNYLNHTVVDAEKDKISGQATLAVRYGKYKVLHIANKIYPIEIILLSLLLSISVPTIKISIIIIVVIFLIIWWKNSKLNAIKPFPTLNDLHEIWLPILLLIYLVYRHPDLFPLLIIHTILFPKYLNKLYYYTFFQIIGPLRKDKHESK